MKFSPDEAHIVYAADEAFAWIMGVSLVSLYENSTDMPRIFLYILEGGLTPGSRERIEKICSTYQRNAPVWIRAGNIHEETGMQVHMDRHSPLQYARIFMGRHIKAERVLYLDCDVMFRESVRILWNYDLRGKTVAALRDPLSRYYRKQMGLGKEDILFNDGIMLIDMTLWKKNRTEKKALEFIRSGKGYVICSDLGALNAALKGKVISLPPVLGAITTFYDFTYEEMLRFRRPDRYYSRQEIEEAYTPSVVHFTGSFASYRPWESGCTHPYRDEWRRYQQLSRWQNRPLKRQKKGICTRIVMKLPRGLMIRIAGIADVYARPLLVRIKRKLLRCKEVRMQ